MASVFAQGATSALSYTVAVKWKMTVRKSGIQARHLHISACKRSCLRHASKLAYPVKPLNVKSLDRPIRAHKKKGNHPAGVIVDVQFLGHSTATPL